MPQSPAETPSAPIDAQWLERMRSTKPDFLRRLFEVYLEDEPKRLAELAKAVAGGDATMTHHIAHSLKGAAATLGMQPLSLACRELEHAAKGESPRPWGECLAVVQARIAEVFATMREIMPTLGAQK